MASVTECLIKIFHNMTYWKLSFGTTIFVSVLQLQYLQAKVSKYLHSQMILSAHFESNFLAANNCLKHELGRNHHFQMTMTKRIALLAFLTNKEIPENADLNKPTKFSMISEETLSFRWFLKIFWIFTKTVPILSFYLVANIISQI